MFWFLLLIGDIKLGVRLKVIDLVFLKGLLEKPFLCEPIVFISY